MLRWSGLNPGQIHWPLYIPGTRGLNTFSGLIRGTFPKFYKDRWFDLFIDYLDTIRQITRILYIRTAFQSEYSFRNAYLWRHQNTHFPRRLSVRDVNFNQSFCSQRRQQLLVAINCQQFRHPTLAHQSVPFPTGFGTNILQDLITFGGDFAL